MSTSIVDENIQALLSDHRLHRIHGLKDTCLAWDVERDKTNNLSMLDSLFELRIGLSISSNDKTVFRQLG